VKITCPAGGIHLQFGPLPAQAPTEDEQGEPDPAHSVAVEGEQVASVRERR
jgi:hypothetical protein